MPSAVTLLSTPFFRNLHTELMEHRPPPTGHFFPYNEPITTPSVETFANDPLRILRLIRFVSLPDSAIAPPAKIAMKLPEIKASNPSCLRSQVITHTS